jgi:hypothetical protein
MRASRQSVGSTLAIAGLVLIAAGADAQWLKLPTPGIPRLPDGKPNLEAPAPRTPDGKPDFSGLWENQSGDYYYNNIAVDLQPGDVAPWAEALYQKRRLEFGKDSMETRCLPFGPVYLTTRYRQQRIMQTPTLITFLFDDLVHRQIFMDGRQLEENPNPTWMGYSVGRWEGDVLVVESNGYSERSWLDFDGHPHTEELRITERYRRRDFGHIEMQVTMVDPKAYLKPITFTMPMQLQADTEMLEYYCDNNTSRERISRTPAVKPVPVPAATLAGYAGVYDLVDSNNVTTVAAVTVSGPTLFLDYSGRGKESLIPLSATRFSWSGAVVEFSTAASGAPTLTIHYAEGSEGGPRRK